MLWNHFSNLVYLRPIKNPSLFYLSLSPKPYLTNETTSTLRISTANTIPTYAIFQIDSRFYLSVFAFYRAIQCINICNIQVLKKSYPHPRNWCLEYWRMGLSLFQKIRFNQLGLAKRNYNWPRSEVVYPILDDFNSQAWQHFTLQHGLPPSDRWFE